MPSAKDSIYANPLQEIGDFSFDSQVVDVFPDMIRRSVPGYNTIINAIGLLTGKFAQHDSYCYDLGCSLGAATLSMRQQIEAENCTIIAVDNSQAMIEQLQDNLFANTGHVHVETRCADVRNIDVQRASVVVVNFTLQFIPLADRHALLSKIYRGMLPGGILIISEKIQFNDACQQNLQTEMHHAFKKAQGYSDLEISQKRTALENVLIPETFAQHQQRLLEVGFNSAEQWFQYFNFVSMVALK